MPHVDWCVLLYLLAAPQVMRNLAQQENMTVKRRFGPYIEQMVQLLKVSGGWADFIAMKCLLCTTIWEGVQHSRV